MPIRPFNGAGRAWSMVLWPLPENRVERTQLMYHEAFHSVQEGLGYPMNGAINTHLDQEQARVLIRLEWNALLQALIDEKQRTRHITMALQLRSQRFAAFKKAKQNEEALEINEALAEYTGVKLRGSSREETLAYLKKRLENVPKIFSLTRSSAYYSGPLYGLLFDAQSQDWKSRLVKSRTFMKTAKDVFKLKTSALASPIQASTLELYGNREIVQYEHQRVVEINAKIAKYLKQIHQPKKVEMFFEKPQMVYNPYGMLSVSDEETIYTTYELRDVWGELIVTDGAYLRKNKKTAIVTVSPATEVIGDVAKGNGWTLKLNPGWKLVKKKDSYIPQKM
jgi:hypothetical protein